MAFCGKCGSENNGNKFCISCGAEILPVAAMQSDGEAVKARGNVRKDSGLVCPKCGKNECYRGKNQNPEALAVLEDYCVSCDIPMVLSKAGEKKANKSCLVQFGIGAGISLVIVYWAYSAIRSPEPDTDPVTSSQVVEEPAKEDGLSSTHCYNVRADVGVVNDMIATGDRDSVIFALDFQAEMADAYASHYSGEINHDLQVLADVVRESSADLQNGGTGSPDDINAQVKKVLAHCN